MRPKLASQRDQFVGQDQSAREICLVSKLESLLILRRNSVGADRFELIMQQRNKCLPLSKLKDVCPIQIVSEGATAQVKTRLTQARREAQLQQVLLVLVLGLSHVGVFSACFARLA